MAQSIGMNYRSWIIASQLWLNENLSWSRDDGLKVCISMWKNAPRAWQCRVWFPSNDLDNLRWKMKPPLRIASTIWPQKLGYFSQSTQSVEEKFFHRNKCGRFNGLIFNATQSISCIHTLRNKQANIWNNEGMRVNVRLWLEVRVEGTTTTTTEKLEKKIIIITILLVPTIKFLMVFLALYTFNYIYILTFTF